MTERERREERKRGAESDHAGFVTWCGTALVTADANEAFNLLLDYAEMAGLNADRLTALFAEAMRRRTIPQATWRAWLREKSGYQA